MDADTKRRSVIGPAEFAVLVKVYNAVASEPGFEPDKVQQDLLRRYIIAKYRGGMTDYDELLAQCREIARQHLWP